MARKKWLDIYHILRDRIIDEIYPPDGDFPTNLQLMKEFEVHSATIQNAVNALIRDGLIFSSGSNPNRRKVRPIPYRSNRRGDFLEEHGDLGKEELFDIKILYEEEDLPKGILDELAPPVLYYHTKQYRNDILIAVTRSYIPSVVPLKELREMLKQPHAMIYDCLKLLGIDPVDCQENLITSLATQSEMRDLDLPVQSSVPIVRVVRRVFESDGRLVQVCYMVDRADCYEFEYRFPLF
ncbi:GntR family transcriptional regulator [Hazenella sp. IB182357]|uniref:GntR family transcriptional regulator n=1 Tax=Polycladospora coralii TaxID=2771432 RepID=A0A926NGZ5_9BACL|nr:GntR family transcriptional regulator [Polycladospora coralii]MBD1373404.1 GntR family transcriptional regulator [Polycladospora coralii]